MRYKLIRASTDSIALDVLLKGQLAFLQQYFDVVAVAGGKPLHLQNVREREKVKCVSISMERKISPIKDFISLIKLYRFFLKEKPFIVHSITPKAGLLCMAAAYFAGVPFRVHTFTGLVFPSRTGIMHQLLKIFDSILCSFATHVYPEGEGIKKDLIRFKITKKPLNVIANGSINGIDLGYFCRRNVSPKTIDQLRSTYNVAKNDFVFLYIGRLVSDKGVNELVGAFASLLNESENIKLLLVGPFESELDPLSKNTLNLINESPSIIKTGYKEDVRPFLVMADVLVLPSYREGFPNVVLQAGAMGLPSIVTDINGSNEIITPGVNGAIIPPRDEKALLKAMKNSIQLRAKEIDGYSVNTRNRIEKKYDQPIVWKNLVDEYDRILRATTKS